ncbi:MAG: ATP-binding protein [Chloroflexota bacterium]|nr:ATP-binding protein [Chloroflexota bacterium]
MTAQDREPTSVGQVPMERLRTIFDGMFDGVWLVGADGRTTYANAAIAGMLGTSPGGMQGRPITDFLSKEFQLTAEALIDNQRESNGERVDLRFLRSDGADLWVMVAASPILTAEGAFVGSMLNVSDVTGKRAAQNRALQNQKLEAIGAFAAGISHDFNNLLTGIRGYAELASAELDVDHPAHADLEQVIASADRARDLTGKLLAFTRHSVLTPIPIDPAMVIRGLLPILRPLLSDAVTVVIDAKPLATSILVDPIAFEQILLNLSINAHDAMPSGGTLTITLDEIAGHGRQSLGADEARVDSVRLRVADTGVGMDDAIAARIFDPFFTTKAVGKGTGLGLSTVYGLISQLSGQISVESTVGKGTTFTMIIPKAKSQAVDLPDAAALAPRTTEPGVVLLVEDEPSVREFARRVLTGAGHTVLTAGEAEEGMRVAGDEPGAIDVLLTDVMMPGVRGPVLAGALRKARPELGVIYMSGYAAGAIPGKSGPGPEAAFLAKPFTAVSLVEAVADALTLVRAHPSGDDPSD